MFRKRDYNSIQIKMQKRFLKIFLTVFRRRFNVVMKIIVTGRINEKCRFYVDATNSSIKNRECKQFLVAEIGKKSALRGNRIIYIKDGQIFGDCNLGEYTPDNPERTAKFEKFITEMGW